MCVFVWLCMLQHKTWLIKCGTNNLPLHLFIRTHTLTHSLSFSLSLTHMPGLNNKDVFAGPTTNKLCILFLAMHFCVPKLTFYIFHCIFSLLKFQNTKISVNGVAVMQLNKCTFFFEKQWHTMQIIYSISFWFEPIFTDASETIKSHVCNFANISNKFKISRICLVHHINPNVYICKA